MSFLPQEFSFESTSEAAVLQESKLLVNVLVRDKSEEYSRKQTTERCEVDESTLDPLAGDELQ